MCAARMTLADGTELLAQDLICQACRAGACCARALQAPAFTAALVSFGWGLGVKGGFLQVTCKCQGAQLMSYKIER